MTPGLVFLIMFGTLLILILLRVPVAFALAFSVIPILILTPALTPILLLQRMMRQYGSFILIAVPFFVLAANLMNFAGITDRLMRLARAVVGFLPGGLGHMNVAVSMAFAGLSGSSNADAAGIGAVMIPAMEKEGYDKNFSVAVTACSAVMGVIIPPSIIMVIWGGVMNVSVGGLFLAGIVPGILIGLTQMGLVYGYALRRDYPRVAGFSLKEALISLQKSLLALLSPVIIVGGIAFGIVTPTEASMVAVLYSVFLGMIVYRTITVKDFFQILYDSVRLASIVLFAVGTAAIYAWVLSFYRVPGFIVSQIGGFTTSPAFTLIIVAAIFLIVGMFIDAVPAAIIFGPLLQPVSAAVGIHPLHFSIVGCIALSYGLITPPYGLTLLISSEIAGINCMRPLKEVGSFLLGMLVVLLLVIFVPEVTLYVPQALMPSAFL